MPANKVLAAILSLAMTAPLVIPDNFQAESRSVNAAEATVTYGDVVIASVTHHIFPIHTFVGYRNANGYMTFINRNNESVDIGDSNHNSDFPTISKATCRWTISQHFKKGTF